MEHTGPAPPRGWTLGVHPYGARFLGGTALLSASVALASCSYLWLPIVSLSTKGKAREDVQRHICTTEIAARECPEAVGTSKVITSTSSVDR